MRTMTVPTDVQITWTPEARETWAAMANHVDLLRAAYGPTHQWTLEAERTLCRISTSFTGWGTLRVMRDGPLSLFCTTPGGFCFGLLFHAIHRRCTNEGCNAVINDDGHAWTYMRDEAMCDSHTLLFPLDAPRPGSWSFHS